jgi:phycoerythrobilin:ferredoxin oxidoreductase
MMLSTRLTKVFTSLEKTDLPFPIEPEYKTNNGISLFSAQYADKKSWKVRKARLCVLNNPGKFFAETLVIYPWPTTDCPIFGCEYLNIGGKKFFGAIDHHPMDKTAKYDQRFLSYLPDRTKNSSKFYDLDEFFSDKFWIKTQPTPFYLEYLDMVDQYLLAYKYCLNSVTECLLTFKQNERLERHKKYNSHMSEKDPARGILKAYFSEEFAESYINNFLFALP